MGKSYFRGIKFQTLCFAIIYPFLSFQIQAFRGIDKSQPSGVFNPKINSNSACNPKTSSSARKARKETLEFLAQVQGFIEKRDELNNLANAVLPLGLANQYSNFPPERKELKQDRDSGESTIEQIKLDPKLAKELMDRIRSDAVLAKKKLDDLGKRIVLAALGVDPLKELFREKATRERIAEGKGDKIQLYFNLGPLKSGERCDEVNYAAVF